MSVLVTVWCKILMWEILKKLTYFSKFYNPIFFLTFNCLYVRLINLNPESTEFSTVKRISLIKVCVICVCTYACTYVYMYACMYLYAYYYTTLSHLRSKGNVFKHYCIALVLEYLDSKYAYHDNYIAHIS